MPPHRPRFGPLTITEVVRRVLTPAPLVWGVGGVPASSSFSVPLSSFTSGAPALLRLLSMQELWGRTGVFSFMQPVFDSSFHSRPHTRV